MVAFQLCIVYLFNSLSLTCLYLNAASHFAVSPNSPVLAFVWQDLKDYMRQAGEVVYADAHRIRPNEGFVYDSLYTWGAVMS